MDGRVYRLLCRVAQLAMAFGAGVLLRMLIVWLMGGAM